MYPGSKLGKCSHFLKNSGAILKTVTTFLLNHIWKNTEVNFENSSASGSLLDYINLDISTSLFLFPTCNFYLKGYKCLLQLILRPYWFRAKYKAYHIEIFLFLMKQIHVHLSCKCGCYKVKCILGSTAWPSLWGIMLQFGIYGGTDCRNQGLESYFQQCTNTLPSHTQVM